ncbi:MAG: hypothetical protein ACREVL_12085 [Solimonas sp.]
MAGALLGLALAGCSATTQLTAAAPDTAVVVHGTSSSSVPRSETLSTTSFGNYVFKASTAGAEPLYGVLPLKFNGGYMAIDILFFAPGLFFNLREVFPYYEFDVEQRVVRFRKRPGDEWQVYQPLPAEAERARAALH